MKKSLILFAFLAANTAFSAEECTQKELEALKSLQAQLVLVCDAVDFQKLPDELQNQGIEDQCKTLAKREITMESCAALKAELAQNSVAIPNPATPITPESPKSQNPAESPESQNSQNSAEKSAESSQNPTK